ncbi:SH3 and PX domain-containing protein 2A-like isoform X2 [Ruditapes philippinarum]|uniref:SH3 and PX domain-containing protein 2A-like isoform X2 n=1 Tax=Ruditapes philippinarum TaxID=129788 RepID=UPI00295B1846|nr:SH3 and PX domain-containing protein 2A-like isoform X2 [Ruditapes philippinarum]
MGRTIEDIDVTDVEKRKVPSKHYVYIIHVTWSDQSTNVIYRRYSRFFDFQSQLMDMFPEEAGALDPSKRIIPFLPGKKFFGRSHIREVAIKRMAPIAEYCKSIVRLPRKISQCKDVIQFFELEPDDINPPTGRKASVKAKKISQPKPLEVYVAVSDYKKQEKGEVTLKAGMLVEVVEKTETGWWFVNVEDEQGWVPSTCLEREDGLKEDSTVKFAPGEEEQYLCTEEFRAEGEDEISMERGAVVDVIEKNLEGWWLVRYNGQEGYVPATFLLKTESVKVVKKNKHNKEKNDKVKNDRLRIDTVKNEEPMNNRMTSGPEIVKSLMDISDLLKEDSETPSTLVTQPSVSQVESDDDIFDDDDDDDYIVPQEEENIYSVQELSKILREDKKGCAETNKVYESIQNMKSRSLKRYGSTRPPPRPSIKPSPLGFNTPTTKKPPLVHSESFCTDYVTIAAFSDVVGDGISFQEGQIVKVLEKNENGWWYIEIDEKEGWAPAAYIERAEPAANSVLPVVNKARMSSPLAGNKSSSPSRSREDLTNGDSDENSRRTSTVGDLASAIKNKLSKGNKQPPTPPKKDFLTDNDIKEEKNKSGHFESGKLQIPGGFQLPGQHMGLKKVADRSSQPPPPAPPANRSMQPPPPAPPIKAKEDLKPQLPVPPAKVKGDLKPPSSPVKTSDDPKPSPFGAALKPTPPKKNDTKLDNKPKPPSLPMKPHNEKPKPVVPIKQNDNKPKVPVKTSEPSNESESSVAGMASALKAKFDSVSVAPKPATSNLKPKPPVKSKVGDGGEQAAGNVAGLAGMLKARFEASGNEKPETQTPKPNVNPKVTPGPPPPIKKPGFGNPSIPSKPRNSGLGPPMPTKPWAKKPENMSPPTTNRPLSTKSNIDMPKPRKSESNDDDTGAHKVSDLANVLKAKFENRQNVGDSPGNEIGQRASKPLPPSKAAIKPFQKPARPSTPPSPRSNLRKNQGRQLPSPPIARSSSSGIKDNDGLDPKKYSSRPLPPQPNPPVKMDTTSKPAGKVFPALPVKPKSPGPAAHFRRADSSESSDSNDDSKPVGVSNLANALKAKLGGKGPVVQESSYLTPADEEVINNLKSDSDIENNNVGSDNLYSAIADFAGHNEGEIRLVQGQQVELLETAEGWSYVSIGGNEGWAPSTYLEKVGPGTSEEPGSWTGSQSLSTTQTVFKANAEFIAENDGELSVSEGQDVNVLDKEDPDWWFVETAGNEGWVPASYIEEVTV